MKPAPFEYCLPSSVAEALEALASSESARVLAGGQSLIPAMNFRLTDVSLLVDIRRVEGLDAVSVDSGGRHGRRVRHPERGAGRRRCV